MLGGCWVAAESGSSCGCCQALDGPMVPDCDSLQPGVLPRCDPCVTGVLCYKLMGIYAVCSLELS